MASDTAAQPPVPFIRLKEIANEACDSTFASVTSYHHPSTEGWNTAIINSILAALIKATSPSSSTPAQSPYKFAVTSTIIEHVPSSRTTGIKAESEKIDTNGGEAGALTTPPSSTGGGRRGMHSATGAYWNTEKDGMWSFKYEAGEGKGLDVVVGILWIAV